MVTPRKLFDLQKANRSLPLVSRVVGDILRVNRRVHELYEDCQRLVRGGREEEAVALQDEMQGLAFERAEYISELEKIGCELKDADVGMVDFPSRLGDRIVLLCWKYGENEVSFWHEVHTGFAGRQPTTDFAFNC